MKVNFAFFGTDEFSVLILNELKKEGLVPSLVVTAPDRKKGRGMKLTPPPAKVWAEKNDIEFLQPEKLDDDFYDKLRDKDYDLFGVASYGKIIPKRFLEIPKHGALNVHPSLLPLYRGPSPIQSQILDDAKEVGVTIIKMDEKMDHGPIVGIKNYKLGVVDIKQKELEKKLAKLGGRLLADIIPNWIEGEIIPQDQKHSKATYTQKITKQDGLINLSDAAEINFRKFLAYTPWPGVYFFKSNKRVKITDAELKDNKFIIKKIIPEGKKEVNYNDFLKSAYAE